MNYRRLGKTGVSVSEIGYGGEHITDANAETSRLVLREAVDAGINVFDVFMPQPAVRTHMGDALRDVRQNIYLQGHIGATMNGDQYEKTRDIKKCDLYVKDFL
ncbi:MAG: aldo/keto reductase, partial [Oscillospiraceae bacterium]